MENGVQVEFSVGPSRFVRMHVGRLETVFLNKCRGIQQGLARMLEQYSLIVCSDGFCLSGEVELLCPAAGQFVVQPGFTRELLG